MYYLDVRADENSLKNAVKNLFEDKNCGSVFRVKGFVRKGEKWIELNATRSELTIRESDCGQDIVIVIGESLNKDNIERIMSF